MIDGAVARGAAGALVAATIALIARRAGSLSPDGAVAAFVVGTIAAVTGWHWALLLIVFFVTSTLLSRIGAETKATRTSGIVDKGGERDAVQVLANGGVFAGAALLALVSPWGGWPAIAAGSLAAAAADTWATEIGTLVGGVPRTITRWRPIPPGTSGGVTPAGLAATVAGAAAIAIAAALLGWPRSIAPAIVAGGVAGSLIDSLAGALWQSRRRCDVCDMATEQRIHQCGAPTRASGGVAWLDNDAVNFGSALLGGIVTLALAHP